MPETGHQVAKVIQNRLFADEGKTPSIGLKLGFNDGSTMWTYAYLSSKAIGARMPHRQLAKVGLDLDKIDLAEIHENPQLLAGKEVMVDVEEENGRLKASISIEGKEVPKKAISALQDLINKAKKDDPSDEPEPEIPF